MTSDLDIIMRIRKGDEGAFEELILLHQKKVYNIALRMTGNHDDALDLSQEVFIRVYRSIDGFKGDSSFATWLYRLTMNVCIDHSRRKRPPGGEISLYSEDGGERASHIPDERYSPEARAEKNETARMVWQALDRLSEEHRRVMILRELSGLSYAEIARVLGIEEGTVKSRIARARENIRRTLIASGNFFGE